MFHVPHHFQPLTHSLGNYLYPSHKCSAQRSRQASLFCWQPQDMWSGAGPRANVQVYEPDTLWGEGIAHLSFLLLCDLRQYTEPL